MIVFLKKLKIILNFNKWLIIIILITLIQCLFRLTKELPATNEQEGYEFVGTVRAIHNKQEKIQLELEGKTNVLATYYIDGNLLETFEKIHLGDYVKIVGTLKTPSVNSNYNLFNYRKYLLSKKISYIIDIDSIVIINKSNNFLYNIKSYLEEKIEKNQSSKYLKAFILGNNEQIEDDIKDSYQINGVSHLFSVSGMHVSYLSSILLFVLKKINKKEFINHIILFIILLFYCFLTSFSPSILRSVFLAIIIFIKKQFQIPISSFKLFVIMTCLFLIYNPWYVYNTGFLYSFIISGFLIYFNKILSKKRYLYQLFMVSFIAFLASFPISILTNFEINIISIFLNLVFVPFVSNVVFPFSFLTFLFPILSPIYEVLIFLLENISLWCSEKLAFIIPFSKPSLILMFFYYISIIYFLNNIKKKKAYIFIIIIIYAHYHIHSCLFNPIVTILDVGQGDSILIEFPYDKGNVLIDTGGSYNSSYSTANNIIIPYLKSIGIKQIDYLISTHGDYDHMGEAINLVNNFKVEKVIFNCGEFNELEQELIKVLNKKKIPYYACIKELDMDDNKLYFLNNKDYGNENDNSSVIYTELNNHKFLFMGDAGVEVEEDLIDKYNLQDIDVLKAGHHGSKTSSSKSFIDEINPKYSIISVGKNNRYDHPNDNVLDNLKNSKIYRTDKDGSIMFNIKNNKLQLKTCPL